jgi:hypothetical protein
MGYIRVIYRKKEYFDYVSNDLLDGLISRDEISHFYRPSEKRWISVRADMIRGRSGSYQGPERRVTNNKPEALRQKAGKGISNTQVYKTKWLEGLWQHIEGL